MKILKANTAVAIIDGAPHRIEKPRKEWTTEDKRKANLDNVAKDILYKTLDKVTFRKIKMCQTAKEIWEKLIQLCEGNERTKENKLSVVVQKFDNIKMKAGESMHEYDERVSCIINELNALLKVYSNKEVALKVVRGLPKAYEFELQTREVEPSTSAATTALTVVRLEPTGSVEKSADQLSNDAMSLFAKKFGRFMRKNQRNFQRQYQRNQPIEESYACYNCGKSGHFIADCPKPKKDSR
ncbi:uncharacterized protein [Primulina huaijiensis]|uniref:uncharacterized protein n=1 Tax=Primulina huaijiensis TaxID=1492673 RepID=UPI003CC757B7